MPSERSGEEIPRSPPVALGVYHPLILEDEARGNLPYTHAHRFSPTPNPYHVIQFDSHVIYDLQLCSSA